MMCRIWTLNVNSRDATNDRVQDVKKVEKRARTLLGGDTTSYMMVRVSGIHISINNHCNMLIIRTTIIRGIVVGSINNAGELRGFNDIDIV